MKKLTITICLTLAVLLGSVGVSTSADFQKGITAIKIGDFATALREFSPLAKLGDAHAQNSLGVMYSYGQGVSQDPKTAVKWYTLAAKQGHPMAQYNLGVKYDFGEGVLQDYKTAVKWYTLAAKQGVAPAQSNLGVMYDNGRGVPQDYVRAHMWFNIAASSGDHKDAFGNRDKVAKRMTPSQIAEAQKLARECVRKKFKGC